VKEELCSSESCSSRVQLCKLRQ